MDVLTVQTEFGELRLNNTRVLKDFLPAEWERAGLTNLDFTLLWKSMAQQQTPRTIAYDLCAAESNIQEAAKYFAQRIPEAKTIIMVNKPSPHSLQPNRLPKMLLERYFPDYFR